MLRKLGKEEDDGSTMQENIVNSYSANDFICIPMACNEVWSLKISFIDVYMYVFTFM